jgi:hypothetical protein
MIQQKNLAQVYLDLLTELEGLDLEGGAEGFTRPALISVLEVVSQHIDRVLEVSHGTLEDGQLVVSAHPVVTQLNGLIDALKDLDTGITDPIFKPNEHGANATLPWRVREQDAALVEAIAVFQSIKGIARQKEAAKQMAAQLNKNGYRRRGKQMTGTSLQRLKYD